MAEVSKSRLSLDIEEIERQLRRSASQPAASKSDPLAELARIVGQEDPFRALLAGERAASQRPTSTDDIFARREPFFDSPPYGQNGHGGYDLRGSLADDEAHPPAYRDQPFALTAEEEALLHGHHGHHYAADPHDPGLYYDDAPDYGEGTYAPVPPRRSRKGLMAAAAVVAAAALAGAGAWALRPGSPVGVDGQPPVVKADSGPLKIAPQNPGGIDIPNQNKKIYEPAAPDTQTRVVNREEQPIDIRQAMRSGGAQPEAAPGAGPVRLSPAAPQAPIAPGGATPSPQGPNGTVAGILGEPRRVRTVSIRPDGTIVMPEASGTARPAPIPPPPAMVMPSDTPRPATPGASTSPPSQSALPPRPRDISLPSATPRAAEPQAGAPLQISPEAARKSDPRLAAPPSIMREPTETSAAPTASGYSVQLGVRTTEREARQAFDQFQQRYAGDLSGFSPLILQAEINGKTAYRVRVGPMSRDDATSLCTRLKTSGGQCFVANN
jgi:hypothetical protein